jgi:ABC-type iron transport system FetAB ATPase subunit
MSFGESAGNREPYLLQVSNLTGPTYDTSANAAPTFSNVSFNLRAGEVLVIRGPSGVGKSVLLKCIAHLLVFPSGEILYQGRRVEDLGVPAWRARVLYLPQRPALLPGTPREFFHAVNRYEARSANEALRKVGAVHGAGRRDPFALTTAWKIDASKWDQTWGQLSGGEAQRLALAIGLSLEPHVLLLDGAPIAPFVQSNRPNRGLSAEPTSALDPETTLVVEETLLNRTESGSRKTSPTIIWVTHSQEQADRVGTKVFTMNRPLRSQEV